MASNARCQSSPRFKVSWSVLYRPLRTVPSTLPARAAQTVACTPVVRSSVLSWLPHGVEALQRALNANLPPAIALVEVCEAAPDFHPRFDARRRSYRYYVYNAPVRSPLRHLRCWHLSQPLDLALMNEAAAYLVGEHDFATFGQPPQGENSVRGLSRTVGTPGPMLLFTIEGNAFLQRMVRSIVGSLRLVGDGRWTVDDFVAAFRARDRDPGRSDGAAGRVVPDCREL